MKLLKKIFGSDKKNKKYESNTLAEVNESPDKYKDDVKTAEPNDQKKATVKKTTPTATKTDEKATKPTAKKPEAPAKESATKVTKASEKKTTDTVKKPTTKAAKETAKPEENKTAAATKTAEKSKERVTKVEDKEKKSTSDIKPSAKAKAVEVEESTSTDAPVKNAKSGKFEIKKSKDGRYVFNLYASNNVIVATSQVYSSSTSAMNGIKSVIANAPTAPIEDQTLKTFETLSFPKWEIYRDKGEQYRFRLSASNGSCVCHSQGYTSKANCKKGIESIIKFASGAEINKAYLNKDN